MLYTKPKADPTKRKLLFSKGHLLLKQTSKKIRFFAA